MQVAKYALHCLLVLVGGVAGVLTEASSSEGNVGAGEDREPHDAADDLLELLDRIGGSFPVVLDELRPLDHRSVDSTALVHLVTSEQCAYVRPLLDGQGASRSIANDLDTQDELSLTQILHVELSCELLLEALEVCWLVGGDEQIVDVEGDDGERCGLSTDVDALISIDGSELVTTQCAVHLDVPRASCLLESIQALLQLENEVLLSWDHVPFRLSHVDGLLQLTIEVGGLDVHLMQLEVIMSDECQHGADGGVTSDGSVDLIVVDAPLLPVASRDEASLVLDDAAVCCSLGFVYPAARDDVGAFWCHDWLAPCRILHQRAVLDIARLYPLSGVESAIRLCPAGRVVVDHSLDEQSEVGV